jgi:fructose-1-phosphate kinase PfkB-like protein
MDKDALSRFPTHLNTTEMLSKFLRKDDKTRMNVNLKHQYN